MVGGPATERPTADAVLCCHCGKVRAEHFEPGAYPYKPGEQPRVPCLMLTTNFNLRTDGA